MRVNPIENWRPTGAADGARAVAARRTPATPGQLKAALARAHVRVTGRAAGDGLLTALTAQVSLETAHGDKMYNYNFGGIKGAGPGGKTASYGTHEVFDGREVHLKQNFRAYDSIDQGADDYVRLMYTRYGGALEKAGQGDLDGFAHALKQAHYYTAPEEEYAAALHGNTGAALASTTHRTPADNAGVPGAGLVGGPVVGENAAASFGSTADVARIMAAVTESSSRLAVFDDDA